MKQRMIGYMLLAAAWAAAAACTQGLPGSDGPAVPTVNESVFLDVYDVPVYHSLYGSEDQRPLPGPGNPLGTGASTPKPPLRRD